MRVVAHNSLTDFWRRHPETEASLTHWYRDTRKGAWKSMLEIGHDFPSAKVLNAKRIRFEIHGGDYRLIASVNFAKQIVYVKFLGTHAEYDRVDALQVSQF